MSEGSVEEDGNGRQPEHSSTDEPSTPRVLVILALVLERLVTRNDQLESGYQLQLRNEETAAAAQGKNLKVFHGVRAPNISIPKYLERIYKYSNCSPSCFVVGFIYIDRLIHRYPELLVVSLNVHRLLVTSVMVASKMLDDEHYNNEFYAKVGGVSNEELNRLEVELLFLLDFEVVVSSSVFETYCFHLETEMMRITMQKPLTFDLVDDLNDSIAEEDAT
ncbi:hypothetical protein Nepgr_013894 [Nepenthes gracilis]|uniref:Cyclin n=1 Tax=Nepenthes gracilis TaxID=150966 RepID=A0AAD3SIY3_NEPGR|nr:hypothetical protein Nepgr_013894 [Nepenthes gracilis]